MRLLHGLCSIIFDELNHVFMVDNSYLLVSALLAGFCLVLRCNAESMIFVFCWRVGSEWPSLSFVLDMLLWLDFLALHGFFVG